MSKRDNQVLLQARICLMLIFSSLSLTSSFASDCLKVKNLKKAQRESFVENDLIFLGKVASLNSDGSYQFEIIEVLKGTLDDSTVVGGNFLNFYQQGPKEIEEIWLVYTSKGEDGSITIPDCGLSRSNRYPFYFGSPHLPPPPPPLKYSLPIFELEIIWLKRQKRALRELQHEIELLRKWKIEVKDV